MAVVEKRGDDDSGRGDWEFNKYIGGRYAGMKETATSETCQIWRTTMELKVVVIWNMMLWGLQYRHRRLATAEAETWDNMDNRQGKASEMTVDTCVIRDVVQQGWRWWKGRNTRRQKWRQWRRRIEGTVTADMRDRRDGGLKMCAMACNSAHLQKSEINAIAGVMTVWWGRRAEYIPGR